MKHDLLKAVDRMKEELRMLEQAAKEPINSGKIDTIAQLCAISGRVGMYFGNEFSYDCFCPLQENSMSFRFEQKIIDFIKDAVDEKIQRDGKPQSRYSAD